MKALPTLLKVARRHLEALRLALAGEAAKLRAAEANMSALDRNVLAEQQRASGDIEATRAYGAFALRMQTRRKDLTVEILALAAECNRIRDLVAEAHVEVRKFERLIETQQARARATRDKREAAALDEMATQRVGRRAPTV